MEGKAGHRDEMEACTGTFQSLPAAFRGSKDASESEEGMERWRDGEGVAAQAVGQNIAGGAGGGGGWVEAG